MAPFTLLAGILTYAWPYATTKGSLIAIGILYGFGSGAYVSLVAVPMIAFGEIEDVGRRVGMAMTILATGALAGPPISGAMNNATGGFKAVGYYAGTFFDQLVAGVFVNGLMGFLDGRRHHGRCICDVDASQPANTPRVENTGKVLMDAIVAFYPVGGRGLLWYVSSELLYFTPTSRLVACNATATPNITHISGLNCPVLHRH